ncbi:PEP/pyruvate-binding domain-containing protein [Pseudomonas sp. CGJS7]|uniref:PEP/pyruvate-binding domain-containing protein n=1 Tax=Pseudomonas sp. CGJS7 TaxID=3109348 RepID=UPI0030087059
MSALLDWAQAAEAGAARAGGKGWQLGRMARLGIAVPEGFVIGAEASQGRRRGDPVPADLLQRLDEELRRRGWHERALAVRSSAPQEDSERASFAGIHRSCLNVRGAAALAQAVAEVWDSAHDSAAAAYRERFGFAADDTAMAVVVMPLLPAVASGVAFTCDPMSGREDRVTINAHWGLGEAMVGGIADADEYRLRTGRIDGRPELLEQRIGAKLRHSRAREDGGTELADTPAQQAASAVLQPAQAVQIASLALDAARALDFARPHFDIEWVWDGARVWIVQARPVTAAARHTYPALQRQPTWWTRGNTREILPEPLSALDWSVYAIAADRMLTLGYELGGYPVLAGVPHTALHRGRVYLNASLIQWEGFDAYGIAPKAMNGLLGGSQDEIAVPPPTWRDRLRRGARLLRYMRRAGKQRRAAAADLIRAREQARQWREQDLSLGTRGLAELLRRQLAQVRGADALFFLQGSAGGTLTSLVDLIDKQCPGEGHALTAALMAGGEPSVTAQQGYDLMALAHTAAGDAQAQAWLRDPARADAQWRERLPAASAFRREFEAFLERYGHRAIGESYLRNPRWREQPGYLLDMALSLHDSDPIALRRRQGEFSEQAWQRLRESMPAWQRPLLRHLARSAANDCNQREAARSALMAYFEALRRTALALGARLVEIGGLDAVEQVFELTGEEICDAAEGRLAPTHVRARALERRATRLQWASSVETELVVEHGQWADTASVAEAPSSDRGDSGGQVWSGTPIGAGRVRGRVRIVRDPGDGAALQRGEILLAASTDPAWTPLFLKAGGLVMETGGFLSHGAIVAREFGIAAVANLPGILGQLRDGETVEVDGYRGEVRRVAE